MFDRIRHLISQRHTTTTTDPADPRKSARRRAVQVARTSRFELEALEPRALMSAPGATADLSPDLDADLTGGSAASSVAVMTPSFDLTAAFDARAKLPATLLAGDGTQLKMKLRVMNEGEVATPRDLTAGVALMARRMSDGQEVELGVVPNQRVGNVKPGRGKSLSISATLPAGLEGDYQIVARLQPLTSAGGLQDSDMSNNVAVTNTEKPIAVAADFLTLTGFDQPGALWQYVGRLTAGGTIPVQGSGTIATTVTSLDANRFVVQDNADTEGGSSDLEQQTYTWRRTTVGTMLESRDVSVDFGALTMRFSDLVMAPTSMRLHSRHSDTSNVTMSIRALGRSIPLTGSASIQSTLAGYKSITLPDGRFNAAQIKYTFAMQATGVISNGVESYTLTLKYSESVTLLAVPGVGVVRETNRVTASANARGLPGASAHIAGTETRYMTGFTLPDTGNQGQPILTPPTLSVMPVDNIAAEPGDGAMFRLLREGNPDTRVAIRFDVTGTATRDMDYTLSTADGPVTGDSILLRAGATSIDVYLDVRDDSAVEPDESAAIQLRPDAAYVVGATSSVVLQIIDDDADVVNAPPTLAPIGDIVVTGPATIYLEAHDSDSSADSLVFTASGVSLAYQLDQQLELGEYHPEFDNWGGVHDKWFTSSVPNAFGRSWYFILSDGSLYAWDGSKSATGALVDVPGPTFYEEPTRLSSASPFTPATLTVAQGTNATGTLQIVVDPNFLGSFFIRVAVDDDSGNRGVSTIRVTHVGVGTASSDIVLDDTGTYA